MYFKKQIKIVLEYKNIIEYIYYLYLFFFNFQHKYAKPDKYQCYFTLLAPNFQ